MCGPHTHIIRDYKNFNPRVNTRLVLLLYVCVAHTHELNPAILSYITQQCGMLISALNSYAGDLGSIPNDNTKLFSF